jgi:hypothetical protein
MSPIATSMIVFVCVFGGALVGMLLHAVLPQNHLSAETKGAVNLGTGIIGKMAALVFGLLVASAKGSYDTQSNELTDVSSRILLPNCGVSSNGLPQLMVSIHILGTRRCKLVFRGLEQTIKAMPGTPHPRIAWLTSSHSPSQRAFNTSKMHFFPMLGERNCLCFSWAALLGGRRQAKHSNTKAR